MWAQSWANILPIVQPYPNRTSVDVSDEMVRQVIIDFKITCL